MMKKPILWRCITLLFGSLFLILLLSCGVEPMPEPISSKDPTMNTFPILAVPPASIPLSGEWSFSIDKDGQILTLSMEASLLCGNFLGKNI